MVEPEPLGSEIVTAPLKLGSTLLKGSSAETTTVKAWQIVLMDAKFLQARRTPGAEAPQDAELGREATAVMAAIAAAADQDRAAHPELPLRADTTASGVTKGGPMMASFPSMHEWFDYQAARRAAYGGS